MNITKIVEKAKKSGFYLKALNIGLNRMVPFNKPHGFKIIEIGDHHLKTMVPYKKANFNSRLKRFRWRNRLAEKNARPCPLLRNIFEHTESLLEAML